MNSGTKPVPVKPKPTTPVLDVVKTVPAAPVQTPPVKAGDGQQAPLPGAVQTRQPVKKKHDTDIEIDGAAVVWIVLVVLLLIVIGIWVLRSRD